MDFQSGGGCSGFLFQLKAPLFFVLLDLLARCLWVLCGFFFAMVVGCCCGGKMVCYCGGGVGCCHGSIGSWWSRFAMVVGVGLTVVGLWWQRRLWWLWWFFCFGFLVVICGCCGWWYG